MDEQEAQIARAVERGLRFLDSRDHGEAELYQKLCRKFDEPTSAAAIAELREMGLVDDEAFALRKAESLAAKGKSGRAIRQALMAAGIHRDAIDSAFDSLELDERAAALSVVRRQYMEKLLRGDEEKVMAALARRGFSVGDSIAALRAAKQEETEEN